VSGEQIVVRFCHVISLAVDSDYHGNQDPVASFFVFCEHHCHMIDADM
jgi:hypothetical protein